ncbi:MAG: hypothetical protein QOJ40_50 [Verrucomicrobiota bacterium]
MVLPARNQDNHWPKGFSKSMSAGFSTGGGETGWPRKRKRSRLELLALLVCALPFLYGLKCIVTLHAKMPFPQKWTYGFPVMPVEGMPAVWTGLGWIALGLFANLSAGQPPSEIRSWFWRILRGSVRWGSLAGAWLCWDKGNALMNNPLWPKFPLVQEILTFVPLGAIIGIVGLLCFLFAMFRREAVRRELHEHLCQPLRIWWQPWAYWAPGHRFSGTTPFRVVYRDRAGLVHRAYCYVDRSLFGSVFGPRQVHWLTDEIVYKNPSLEPTVWVDVEPRRPKLKRWDSTAESRNLLDDVSGSSGKS